MQSSYERHKKSMLWAYIWWACLGYFGAHRFYEGSPIMGFLMLITFGGLGFWWIIDGFMLYNAIKERNYKIERELSRGSGAGNNIVINNNQNT